MILSDLWADSRKQRQAEINNLKQQVQQWKKQTQSERSLVQEELKIQAQEIRQTLSNFTADLQQQGDRDRKQRQNQNRNRHIEVAKLIEEFANKRENYRVELSTNAQILAQQLQNFHHNLQYSVWGINTDIKTYSSEKSPKTKSKTSTPTESKRPKQSPAPELSVKPKTRVEKIYQLIKESKGIGLTEIEQEFNLERKVTIESIRKLIQESMIEQRDRLYFAVS